MNKRNENILFLSAIGQKKKHSPRYYEITKYLVDVCQVDVAHEYEELLLILEDKSIISFIELRLQEKGFINATKTRIDQENTLTKNRPPRREGEATAELRRRLGLLSSV